jgi:hypothetical protein
LSLRSGSRQHDEPSLLADHVDSGPFRVSKEWFRGVGIRNGDRYTVRITARRGVNAPASIRAEFENTIGRAARADQLMS